MTNMIYIVYFKNLEGFQSVYTKDIEVARAVLTDIFFKHLNMTLAQEVIIDASETDTEKTGIVMHCRQKYPDKTIQGCVTAMPEEKFFVTSWKKESNYPSTVTINII